MKETIIQIKNLTKIFNSGKNSEVTAVSDINLEINKGEIVMVMGPSGSGKTTLLTLIGGLLRHSSGTIRIAGEQIENLSGNKLTMIRRDKIGFVFQSFNLLHNLTALENVTVAGFHRRSREKAKLLLVQLGLEKRLYSFPDELSGGERQRVALARALINDAEIILADEPTANLDKKTGHDVMDMICSVGCMQEKTIIIVSHDERIKDIAHRVIYIEDGRLKSEEKGMHNKVCKMKKHLKDN